jgi:activating signal cointegrator complex subunit 2
LSFLQEALPFYLPVKKLLSENGNALALYEKIYKNALRIVCRIITNRQSDEEILSKEKHAKIIYDNFAISIPMIFDLISIYGVSNKGLMKKFIDTLIQIEPNYVNDLKMGIKFIVDQSFKALQKRIDYIQDFYEEYEDISLYLMNIASTINILVDLIPDSIKDYCSKDLKLESAISNFYENFIPQFYLRSYEAYPDAYFLRYINYSRLELINCFRNLLNHGISLILNSTEKDCQKRVNFVLQIFIENAGFKIFIVDYVKLYPFDVDLDILEQFGTDIDRMKLEFVNDAFLRGGKSSNENLPNVESNQIPEEEEGACALPLPTTKSTKNVEKVEEENFEEIMQIEISKVLDIFSHYGTGYIRKLLLFYDKSSEKVISTILEGNLDERFQNVDESEVYIPPETTPKIESFKTIPQRVNREDLIASVQKNEAKFDVKMKGRFLNKKEPKTYGELLNDKTYIQQNKERFLQYSLVTEENEDDKDYDDEPDDSYDDFADSESKVKSKYLKADEESSESEDEEVDTNQQRPTDFCENPEIIRARREQQYQQRMSRKHGKSGNQTQQTRDVVGNAKGQGQSSEVLRNRTAKMVNKSSRANHNRKAGSTWKQSRGMY